MDDHQLETLLQLQMGTDSSAVIHLSYILQTLSLQTFSPSVHLQKWTTRINSLIHSKDSGARWAGLSIALRTSILSKSLMIDCAQSWVGVALPMLSKKESLPCLKACIRLVRYIFSNAISVPEFQRQVVTPNIVKFSQALHSLADREDDDELKILCLSTLSHLILIYPSPHRALHSSLSALSLKLLNGRSPKPSSEDLVQAASQLYSVLPITGGKIGASNLWRTSVDEGLNFTWGAYAILRSTFPQERPAISSQSTKNLGDPVVYIPLNLDRVRCGIIALCHLLRVNTPRPIQLPVGPLATLCIALLSCSVDGQVEGHVDTTVRVMELSVVPAILSLGCNFLACLAKCAQFHLTPYVTRLLSCVTYQLEKPHVPKLPFLKIIPILLTHSHPLANLIIPNRLTKAVLPYLTVLLSSESDVRLQNEPNGTGNGRKGKKRARNYEGDEVFKVTRAVVCSSGGEEDVVIAAVQAIQVLLRDSGIDSAVRSLASKVMLSLYISLPRISPASLSHNLAFHGRLCAKVQGVCVELGSGNTSIMSRSLPLVAGMHLGDSNENITTANDDAQRRLDLLLHPRLPPLVRSMPPVEALSLFRAEEHQGEVDLRKELGLGMVDGPESERLDPILATISSKPGSSEMDVSSIPRHNEWNKDFRHNIPFGQLSGIQQPVSLSQAQSQASVQNSTLHLQLGPEQSGQNEAAPIPSLTANASTAYPSPPKPVSEAVPTQIFTQSDAIVIQLDDDEELPSINMDSDSD